MSETSLRASLRRELRVAFSLKLQPLWFRICKWIVAIAFVWWIWNSRWFWYIVIPMSVAAITIHLLYRWKTQAWSRPWGGWKDVETAYPQSQGSGGSDGATRE
jgi:hypothetical protein